MTSLAIGPIQLLLMIPGVLAYSSLIYILFFNRDKVEFEIPLLLQTLLYFLTLAPLGLFVGLFIQYRKKKINDKELFKFSKKSRDNSLIIVLISSITTILSISNII